MQSRTADHRRIRECRLVAVEVVGIIRSGSDRGELRPLTDALKQTWLRSNRYWSKSHLQGKR
jgi:hypothetical protein